LFNCIYVSSSPRVLYRCVDLDLPSNSDFSLVDDGKPSPEVGVSEQEKNPLKGLANCCFTGRMNAQPHDAWSALRWKADHVRKVGIQRNKNAVIFDAESRDLFVCRTGKTRVENRNDIVAL
jgi:hypothetical protein